MFFLYREDVGRLVRMMRRHFAEINRDPKLTDEDKKRLKEFYLENFVAPRARKILQKHFPEDFAPAGSSGTPRRTQHQHRTP